MSDPGLCFPSLPPFHSRTKYCGKRGMGNAAGKCPLTLSDCLPIDAPASRKAGLLPSLLRSWALTLPGPHSPTCPGKPGHLHAASPSAPGLPEAASASEHHCLSLQAGAGTRITWLTEMRSHAKDF